MVEASRVGPVPSFALPRRPKEVTASHPLASGTYAFPHLPLGSHATRLRATVMKDTDDTTFTRGSPRDGLTTRLSGWTPAPVLDRQKVGQIRGPVLWPGLSGTLTTKGLWSGGPVRDGADEDFTDRCRRDGHAELAALAHDA
jgi:hypothetical protein